MFFCVIFTYLLVDQVFESKEVAADGGCVEDALSIFYYINWIHVNNWLFLNLLIRYNTDSKALGFKCCLRFI